MVRCLHIKGKGSGYLIKCVHWFTFGKNSKWRGKLHIQDNMQRASGCKILILFEKPMGCAYKCVCVVG